MARGLQTRDNSLRIIHVLLILVGLFPGAATATDLPVLKIAVLKFGTVNWLLDAVRHGGHDRQQGVQIEVTGFAGKPATTIAFQSGDADLLVTDWFWALRQREEGADLRFSPYSSSLGALMTRGDVARLCDLRNRRLGIVGGSFDKSWLVFQAVIRKRCGFEAAAENEILFGAPPLMSQQLNSGEVDAVSTFWHWAARMEAGGNNRMLSVTAAMAELGIDPAPPLVGFVWDAGRTDAATVQAFLRAANAARSQLATDDAAWERLRRRMKADDDATFTTLRDRFREGIPSGWTASDTAMAGRLHAFVLERAPAGFARKAGAFDPQVFDVTD